MLVRDITQLHQLELMRTDFVGNVSHELGTPITVIKGYIEALLANANTFDEKWARPIKQMQDQTVRMESILNDLLLLSSLETKAIPSKQDTSNLLNILTLVTNDTQNTFSKKGHEYKLSCSNSIEIEGDSTELQSAISNLASNAAKYTEDNGLIEIGANIDNNTLNIFVKDNGTGIINEHIPRLTERFYRVDTSRSSDTGGTGLGLAIVKHILIRHDAELEIHSYPGQGSCFTCKFPKKMISNL
jgi:two-component system phosphate regulon sensor histidine kinase PhoR